MDKIWGTRQEGEREEKESLGQGEDEIEWPEGG